MSDYFNIINSYDILDIISKKITIEQLKQKKTDQYCRLCRDDKEKTEAIQYVEEAFLLLTPFLLDLTLETYDAISKYGRKIGTNSYEINTCLRQGLPLSPENKKTVELLDKAMDNFNLNEEMVVYRALKPTDALKIENIEKGYMILPFP